MSGRYRIIALQAVGVAVLAAIVYLAFLRPSEPDPLSGITGPGVEKQANNSSPNGRHKHPGKHEGHREPAKRSDTGKPGKAGVTRPGSGGQSAGEERGAGSPGSSQAGPSTVNPGPGPGGNVHNPGNPDTPPGSQYQDTVARITAKLNE